MDVVLWRDLPVPSPQQLTLVKWQAPREMPREIFDGDAGSMGPEDGAENVAGFFPYYRFRTLRQDVSSRAELAAFTGFSVRVSISYAGHSNAAWILLSLEERFLELVYLLPVDELHHSGLIPVAEDDAFRCCALNPVEVIARQNQFN